MECLQRHPDSTRHLLLLMATTIMLLLVVAGTVLAKPWVVSNEGRQNKENKKNKKNAHTLRNGTVLGRGRTDVIREACAASSRDLFVSGGE